MGVGVEERNRIQDTKAEDHKDLVDPRFQGSKDKDWDWFFFASKGLRHVGLEEETLGALNGII